MSWHIWQNIFQIALSPLTWWLWWRAGKAHGQAYPVESEYFCHTCGKEVDPTDNTHFSHIVSR